MKNKYVMFGMEASKFTVKDNQFWGGYISQQTESCFSGWKDAEQTVKTQTSMKTPLEGIFMLELN